MLISLFLIAFFTSFFGSTPPSMLNISCLKISLESGQKSANNYSLAISLVTFFQAYVGIFLAKEIDNFPKVLSFLEQFATLIFFCLAYYFYRAYKNQKKTSPDVKREIKKPFMYGLVLSSINMFAIPFYFGVITSLYLVGLFSFDGLSKFVFLVGSSTGTYLILFFYGKFALLIDKKLNIFTKHINLILSIITLIVAILALLKSIYQ